MSIGEHIKILREQKGLSQRQLAKFSSVSNTEISKIESGERKNPAPDILRKLAPHLNTNYEDLMMAAGYMNPYSVELQSFLLSNDFVYKGRLLTKEEKEKLINMLDIIVR